MADRPDCLVEKALEGVSTSKKTSQETLVVVQVRDDNSLDLVVTVVKARSDECTISFGSRVERTC